jgi:hypothetical protein
LYSGSSVHLVNEIFDVRVTLNKENLIQLRRMNDETPAFPLHHDYVANEDNIVMFLYLSPGWNPARGGCLNLFEDTELTLPAQKIEPIENRLVAFRTKENHWHSVEKVHTWERLSALAVWNVAETGVGSGYV